jgi:hypothetical protein
MTNETTSQATAGLQNYPVAAKIKEFFVTHLPKVSGETLEWLTIVVLHCATIPSLLAMMTGLTDRAPALDIVLFVWTALVLMFARSVVLKNGINTVTNGAGFIAQSVLMALILFR